MPGITVLTNARMIDGTGRPPEEDAAVVVEDGRIREVARSGAAPRSTATVIERGAGAKGFDRGDALRARQGPAFSA